MALWNQIRRSGLQRLVQSYQNPSFISASVRSCSVPAHAKQIEEPSGPSLNGDITAQYDRGVTDEDYYCFQCRPQHGSGYAQCQIVNALRLGEREKAYGMLQNLGDGNVSLGPDDFSFVLDYCAQTPDPLFVMETWRIMEEQAVVIDKKCCRAIVKAFSRGGYLKEAFDWLKFVGDHDFAHAMLSLSNIFLSESGSRQSFVDVDHCMELMEKQFVGKSEITYWELLKFAVSQKNLSAVYDIWKDCTNYYTPSIITMRKFIWSFTRLNALKSAYTVLQYMVALADRESAPLRTSSARKYQSSRLDIPIPSNSEFPYKIFGLRDMKHSSNIHKTTMETGSFHIVDDDFLLDSFNLDPFHVRVTLENRISNTVEKDKIYSEMFPCADVSESDNQYLRKGDYMELKLENVKHEGLEFEEMKAKASPPVKNVLRWSFNNVIHACAQAGEYELAERLFMQMHDLGLKPSGDTYDGFVKAVVYGKGVTYGMKVIESMEKNNIKPYNDTLAVLSTGYSKNFELDIAEALLEKISYGLPKYIHPFNAILAACDIMDQPDRAVHIFAKMKHLQIKPNIRTYELLFSLFGNINIPYEKGNMFSHADVSRRINAIEKDMIRIGVQHSYMSMKNLVKLLLKSVFFNFHIYQKKKKILFKNLF